MNTMASPPLWYPSPADSRQLIQYVRDTYRPLESWEEYQKRNPAPPPIFPIRGLADLNLFWALVAQDWRGEENRNYPAMQRERKLREQRLLAERQRVVDDLCRRLQKLPDDEAILEILKEIGLL